MTDEHCFAQQDNTDEGSKNREWAVHQIRATADYETTSWLWYTLSIGLNNQVPHHVFPAVDGSHYRDLLPIFEEVCAKHKVKYVTFPTFASIFKKHFDYVASLNDPRILHRD